MTRRQVLAKLKLPDGSQETCAAAYIAGCDGAHSTVREKLQIGFLATENRAPVIAPSGTTNLWFHAGQWVRGTWPVAFTARDPSGACRIAAALAMRTPRALRSRQH